MRLNSNDSPLNGAQIEAFRHALHSAFYNRESLEEFLLIQLDWHFGDLTAKDNFKRELFYLVKNVDEEGKSAELLHGACLWRPTNVALAMFSQQFGLLPAPSANDVFQASLFRSFASFYDLSCLLHVFQPRRATVLYPCYIVSKSVQTIWHISSTATSHLTSCRTLPLQPNSATIFLSLLKRSYNTSQISSPRQKSPR